MSLQKLFDRIIECQSKVIFITNPIVIYDAMAIVRLVTSEKTWESLLQTLVKPFRLHEAE